MVCGGGVGARVEDFWVRNLKLCAEVHTWRGTLKLIEERLSWLRVRAYVAAKVGRVSNWE